MSDSDWICDMSDGLHTPGLQACHNNVYSSRYEFDCPKFEDFTKPEYQSIRVALERIINGESLSESSDEENGECKDIIGHQIEETDLERDSWFFQRHLDHEPSSPMTPAGALISPRALRSPFIEADGGDWSTINDSGGSLRRRFAMLNTPASPSRVRVHSSSRFVGEHNKSSSSGSGGRGINHSPLQQRQRQKIGSHATSPLQNSKGNSRRFLLSRPQRVAVNTANSASASSSSSSSSSSGLQKQIVALETFKASASPSERSRLMQNNKRASSSSRHHPRSSILSPLQSRLIDRLYSDRHLSSAVSMAKSSSSIDRRTMCVDELTDSDLVDLSFEHDSLQTLIAEDEDIHFTQMNSDLGFTQMNSETNFTQLNSDAIFSSCPDHPIDMTSSTDSSRTFAMRSPARRIPKSASSKHNPSSPIIRESLLAAEEKRYEDSPTCSKITFERFGMKRPAGAHDVNMADDNDDDDSDLKMHFAAMDDPLSSMSETPVRIQRSINRLNVEASPCSFNTPVLQSEKFQSPVCDLSTETTKPSFRQSTLKSAQLAAVTTESESTFSRVAMRSNNSHTTIGGQQTKRHRFAASTASSRARTMTEAVEMSPSHAENFSLPSGNQRPVNSNATSSSQRSVGAVAKRKPTNNNAQMDHLKRMLAEHNQRIRPRKP